MCYNLKYVVILCFLLASCSSKKDYIIEKSLIPIAQIEQLSDSSFIGDAYFMKYYDDRLFISDIKVSQMLVLDSSMRFLHSIGKLGNGPQEMIDMNYFYVDGKQIFIKDPGNHRIQEFSVTGEHVKSIPLYGIDISLINGLLIKDNNLYATSTGDSAIVKYALRDRTLKYDKEFGARYHFKSAKQNRIRNDRFLLNNRENLIAVSDNMPFIEVYDFDGKLVNKIDISDIPVIAEQLRIINRKEPAESSYMLIISQCDIYDNNLYFLLHTYDMEHKRNTILKLSLSDPENSCSLLMLPDDIYSSFAVSPKYLYAFSHSGTLQKFEL